MSHDTDPDLLVLHALRLRSRAPAEDVAGLAGLAVEAATSRLDALATAGLVQHRSGRISGYSLTAEGRVEHERLLAEDLDRAGARGAVEDVYERFLALNDEVLALCTAWQLRLPENGDAGGPPVVNDHQDTAYDRAVLDRLARVDDAAQPICADLAAMLTRLTRYGRGLEEARQRVDDGDLDYVARPLVPSYHSLWFELHEDLLATLGLERGASAVPG